MPQDPQNALLTLSTQQALTKIDRQLAITDKLLALTPAEPDLIPLLLIKKDGTRKWGFANRKKEVVIPCVYDWVDPFSEGLARTKKEEKWGYLNQKGQEIAFIYDNVSGFNEGFANVEKNDKYGFINNRGQEIIPCIYDYAGSFSEGLAWVDKNSKHGFLNTIGQEVIPCIYDYAGDYSEGLAAIVKNGKVGYINHDGEEVIPCKFDFDFENADYFFEDLYFTESRAMVSQNGKWGFIDPTGKEITPYIYDYAGPFSEGLAVVLKSNKIGYINQTGQEVIPFKYDHCDNLWRYAFHEVLAAVCEKGKYHFINKKGESEIIGQYLDATPFSNGLAAVVVKNDNNGYWVSRECGYIDKEGNKTIPCVYDHSYQFSKYIARVIKGRREFYIDKNGIEYWSEE